MTLLYQLRSLIAERFLRWAIELDPTDDERVLTCYRNLTDAKFAQIMRERPQ